MMQVMKTGAVRLPPIKSPAPSEHPKKAGGHDGNARHIKAVGLPKPGRFRRLVLLYGICVFSIGRAALIECLNDLNAAYIPTTEASIFLPAVSTGHTAFIVLHHAHIANKANGDGDNGNQSNTPIQNEHINQHQDGDQNVGRQLWESCAPEEAPASLRYPPAAS